MDKIESNRRDFLKAVGRLIPVAEKNGTEWWVVECERHFDDLSAVTPSYAFLKSKGLN